MKQWTVYTDGSYKRDASDVHGGIVYVPNPGEKPKQIHVTTTNPELVSRWNVGGEILAAWCAVFSVCQEVKKLNGECMDTYALDIIYDYEGIGKWLVGAWSCKNKTSKWFVKSVKDMLSDVPNLKLNCYWVKGHADTYYNEMADAVAFYDMVHCEINNIPICDMDEILAGELQ